MSGSGQTRKYSLRADVFRFAPDSGHVATAAAFPFRATSGSEVLHSLTTTAGSGLPQKWSPLFDHLFCLNEQIGRDSNPECFRDIKVDGQL
jgi:hypothetical protein